MRFLNRRGFIQLLVISFSQSVIYQLPFIQNSYYDTMRETFGLSHVEMGNLLCVYGIVNFAGYILGGAMADRWNSRLLLSFSLIATGISGFWMSAIPPYPVMLALSVFWSVTTILTFWPTMIKATRMLAEHERQGMLFGAKEVLCHLASLGISLSGLWLFNLPGGGFAMLIRYFAGMNLLIGALAYWLLPDSPPVPPERRSLMLSDMKSLWGDKGVILVGLTLFCAIAVNISMGRFTAYTTMVYKLDVSTAVLVMILSTNLVANLGALAGGRLCDRMGSAAKFMLVGFVCMAAGLLALILLPATPSYVWPAVAVITLIRMCNAAMRSVYFVTLNHIRIPPHLTGSAAGFISLIGYSPDAFLYTVWGALLGGFAPEIGFKLIFAGLIGFCLAGVGMDLLLLRHIRREERASV